MILPTLFRNKRAGLIIARGISNQYAPRVTLRSFSSPATYEIADEVNGFDSYNPKFNSVEEEVHDANKRYNNIVEIKDVDGIGRAVIASRAFAKGDAVVLSNSLGLIPQDSHTLQRAKDEHFMIDLPARFINHSCNGNIGIQDNDSGAYDFFALKDIERGEELRWDYETSEFEILGFEDCFCGDAKCRGTLGGFKKHGEIIKKQYGKYYANYLKEL